MSTWCQRTVGRPAAPSGMARTCTSPPRRAPPRGDQQGPRPQPALSTRRIYAIVAGLAAAAGLGHIHPHMLRQTFGATATDLDIARDVLQRLLGHAAITSQEVYRHVASAHLVAAAALIGDRLSHQPRQDRP